MIYATISSEEALKRLNEAIEEAHNNVKWYIRLKIVALSATKQTVKELSQMFDLCEATIRNYIHDYNKGGIQQLEPDKPSGRPAKIAQWTKQQWDEVLEQTPNQYEKLNTASHQWTLKRLQQYVKEYHGIDVCLSSVYDSFSKARKTGRSKLRVGSPDPMYTVKRSYNKEVQNLHSRDN